MNCEHLSVTRVTTTATKARAVDLCSCGARRHLIVGVVVKDWHQPAGPDIRRRMRSPGVHKHAPIDHFEDLEPRPS
jgi:hypothetical protein